MAWLGDREFWVNLIGYASIVSAAIFGLLALFTDYKKEGRVTRWGRLYAGGIALSAVFAMTSSVLQKRITTDERAAGARAADEQRALQKGQFDTQLRQFRGLNSQMEQVNQASTDLIARMTESLRGQARLLGHTQQGLLLTASLGVQERQNTGRVLRRMWNESTRVTSSSITATVLAICGPVRPGGEFPRLFPEGTVAMLGVAPLPAVERLRPFDLFRQLRPRFPDDALTFYDIRPHVALRRYRIGNRERVGEYVSLTSFTTEDSIMERPEDWEGIAVELTVDADRPGIVAAVNEVMAGRVAGGLEALEPGFVVAREARDDDSLSVAVLPCEVWMQVLVNGRKIAERRGSLVYGHDRYSPSDRLVAIFPIAETQRNVFPRFLGR